MRLLLMFTGYSTHAVALRLSGKPSRLNIFEHHVFHTSVKYCVSKWFSTLYYEKSFTRNSVIVSIFLENVLQFGKGTTCHILSFFLLATYSYREVFAV